MRLFFFSTLSSLITLNHSERDKFCGCTMLIVLFSVRVDYYSFRMYKQKYIHRIGYNGSTNRQKCAKIVWYLNFFLSKNNSFLHFTVPSMSPVDHPILNNYWRLKVTQRAANDFAIKDFYKAWQVLTMYLCQPTCTKSTFS